MAELTRRARPSHDGRVSQAFLLVIAALVLVFLGLPFPQLVQDLVYSLVSASVVAAILVGIHRYRPRASNAWYMMAAAQSLWVIADTTYNWQQDVMHIRSFPTISDVFYLLGYPVFAIGLFMLVKRHPRARRDLGPLLDSAAVTAGLCLLSWVLLARPTIERMHDSGLASIVAVAYPAMDILLVAALVGLISSAPGRSAAARYLLVALTLLITADTISVILDLFANNTIPPMEPLWLLSYGAWGAAALHPSMAKLSDPVTTPEVEFRGSRLLAVMLAMSIGPAVLAVHEITGFKVDTWAAIIGSVVMSIIVVTRMNLAITQITSVHHSLEVLQDELAVQATHDPLTGLANRIQSMRLLAGALGRARRRNSTVALLFLDLDGFKTINDDYGHRAGDEVLRQVSRRMEAEIRDGDFVGRLGGDEFLIGLEDVTDEDAAVSLANRLIASISKPIHLETDGTVHVGVSIGVSLGRGGATDVETLVHEADVAVYQAKAGGRGRVELFSGQIRAALKERNDLERALVTAIAEDQLVLHYQPIVHLGTGRVECYESLVRWERPGVGLVFPDDFLPFAETSDLICELDAWVLQAAVSQLELWNLERGDFALQVAVNISGRHISQHRILNDVATALRLYEILPPQLVIEVTETAPLDDGVAAENLEALRAMGVVVSLDDFGTGHHSNAQLARLPFDVLKIDRHFVDTSTESARSLLELMVKAAHAFGLRVVAEGVEHQDQLDLVTELGCEYVQGYYFARPLPAHELPSAGPDRLLAG